MTFGAAVELSVAMPLSWLPLISDYTREAKKPVQATAASAITYGVVSCWMYVIGMGAAIYTGEYDIAQIMLKAGLGIVGLLIIIFSTVTTTFLDAWSAGISSESIVAKLQGKYVAVAVTGIAGPDGGTEEKPVGLVYIGCCVKGELTVKEYHFSGTRSQIREATTSAALILMRSCILKYFSKVTFGKK